MKTLLYPNLGAEEGDDWPVFATQPAIATSVRLWRLLFAPPTRLFGDPTREDVPDAWPSALGPEPAGAALQDLDGEGLVFAWLATEQAERHCRERGLALAAADARLVVRRVHDKAFALRVAHESGHLPAHLEPLLHVFEAAELRRHDAFLEDLTRRLADWPEWTGGRFTLKPRFGGSGRGRVAGRTPRVDTPDLRGSLPRLAARGGAVLEPWLERRLDLSTLLFVPRPDSANAASPAPIRLLASLEQWLTPSGLYLGHLGEVDSRGRVFSGSGHDEAVREAAVSLATRAREAGYFGPCGVDAFVFALPNEAHPEAVRECLRPIVELNARFTLGLVALGLVRRALVGVRERIALEPGARRGFLFALDRPARWPSWPAALETLGPGAAHVDLRANDAAAANRGDPALLFAPRLEALRALIA